MLREGYSPKTVHLNVISNWGGLGDSLARIPAIKWGLEQFPHVSMTVYWHDYFLELAQYLYQHERLTHSKISAAPRVKTPGFAGLQLAEPVVDFNPDRITSLALHLTQHAFLSLYDRVAEPAWMQYEQAKLVDIQVREALVDKKYIVFTAAATVPVREWPSYEVNALAESCIARGLTPVLLGSTTVLHTGDSGTIEGILNDGLDRSLFVDLTNSTSLIEALGIMQRASAVVGLDNGLLHLAHYTTTPVVAGYTSVEAKYRVPHRANGQTLIVEAKLPCYGCQSKCGFVNTDFRFCTFNDYACTLTMSAKAFEEKIAQLTLS